MMIVNTKARRAVDRLICEGKLTSNPCENDKVTIDGSIADRWIDPVDR